MTKDKALVVLAELEAVCRKHNVMLAGTCSHEGIYGEITIHERGTNPLEWRHIESRRQNLSSSSVFGCCVDAIGNEPIIEGSITDLETTPYAKYDNATHAVEPTVLWPVDNT